MCGVAGSLGRPGSVKHLLRMLEHRGPDCLGIVEDPPGARSCAVGAVRLRINGGPDADMPLVSSSGRTVVAVNGEIFNHREILGDHGQNRGSDLAGLADLLETEGPNVLSRLRGPFALIAHDRRTGSLLLARDELGVRPLFYSTGRDHLLAASEVRALREIRRGDQMDRETWDHLLAFQFWPEGHTPWQGIRSLSPGTWMRWELVDDILQVEKGTVRLDTESGDVGSALESAFDLQAAATVKTGIALSGGLDSSAVAALLAERGQAPDVAAVGWFPGGDSRHDERPHARAVARELGIPLVEVPITPETWVAAWRDLLATLGAPLAGPGGPSQWLIASALGKVGVKVLFSGQGGDELFGGYERHRLLQQADLGHELKPAPGYEPLARAIRKDSVRGCLFRGAEFLPHLVPERAAAVLRLANTLPEPGPDLARRTLEWEIRVLLPGLLLVEDHTIAAFGMEGRVPILDPVLAARARGLPLSERTSPAAPRRMFREIVGSRLPQAAAQRQDKMGFPHPLSRWWDGPLQEHLQEPSALASLAEIGFRPTILDAARQGKLSARNRTWILGCILAAPSHAKLELGATS